MRYLKNEQGTALIATLMFLMAMGILSTALVFTVNNEMKTSSTYKYNQQAFYVANAGIQKAVEWYRSPYAPALGSYTTTTLPPQYSSQAVVLAGQSGYSSNFPVSGTTDLFTTQFSQSSENTTLTVDSTNTGKYAVNATLLKHSPANFLNPSNLAATPTPSAIERWRVESMGYWGSIAHPLGIARITATIENNGDAFFDRALWGITEVNLTGTSLIDSYDPSQPMPNSGNLGDVGSNMSVRGTGSMSIQGNVACGPGGSINVDPNSVIGDFIRLGQDRYFPPIGDFTVGSGKTMVNNKDSYTLSSSQNPYGTITVHGTLIIPAGDWYIDSLDVQAAATIIVSGTARLFVKSGLSMAGTAVANDPSHPESLTVFYKGTDDAKWTGSSSISASIYAPNAPLHLAGGSDFYGSFIGNTVDANGGAKIHFDQGSLKRNLLLRPFRIITWSYNSF